MIQRWGIRARVAFAAIVPALLLALVLTLFYTNAQFNSIEEAHLSRARALARQIAAASEYAVFSGDQPTLERLTRAALAEEGVLGVSVIDRDGGLIVNSRLPGHAGPLTGQLAITSGVERVGVLHRITEPILSGSVALDDPLTALSTDSNTPDAAAPPLLGYVVLDLSSQPMLQQRATLQRDGALVVALMLIGTLLLALKMSRGVSRPIREVAQAVERLGRGEFDVRVRPVGGGSLLSLASGVNKMANELAITHDDLNARIASATAELRARKEEAEVANVAKSRFLAAASHDMRQPMHALGLFLAELTAHRLPAESKRLLNQILTCSRVMEALLDSLLDISRLDAGMLEPRPRPVELQSILTHLEATEMKDAERRGLCLKIRPTALWTVTDPTLLNRILSNLVSNAIRYTPAGRILVACRRRRDHVRIEVRDSGIGIPVEAHALIFEEFVQLDNPERAHEKGLGLGLAIVSKLTQLLGHHIELHSTPGQGSVFSLTVPLSQPLEKPVNEHARLPGDLRGIRIAVVDDDALALAGISSLLQSWGCEVIAERDAQTAFARAVSAEAAPTVVLSELRLDREDSGLVLIERLRTHFGHTFAAALLTADTSLEAVATARSACLPLLGKPLRPARLRAFLTRCVVDGT